jgi:hypothetical protein
VHSWCSCFVVVYTIALSKTFCNITDLVTDNTTCVVVFLLTYDLSLPFSGRWPWGSSVWGTRTKTLRSCKLFISSRPPAIQYLRSSEAIACAQVGLSSDSGLGWREPSLRAERISSIVVSLFSMTILVGIRSCMSCTVEYSERKARAWSSFSVGLGGRLSM